jgi:cyclophilin family peptidyl-prolyl cis-trans isomerase
MPHMNYKQLCIALMIGAGLPGWLGGQFAPPSDGMYAVFQTNRGEFAARLHYDEVPMTVANFVGLAEGRQPWIDFSNYDLRQHPFYDGLTFHRVIDGFMIQGGSPNGQGNDGPGYNFPDEMALGLTHRGAGILAMANSGPNSNGSQFYVTLAATDWLDYKHTVFGEVVSGLDVVEAIGKTPVGTGDRPVNPVIIERLTIVRAGAAAQAFDVKAWPVPQMAPLAPRLVYSAARVALQVPWPLTSASILFESTDMVTWRYLQWPQGADGFSPDYLQLDVTPRMAINAGNYFKAIEVPEPVTENLTGSTLRITWGARNPRQLAPIDIQILSEEDGQYIEDSAPYEMPFYRWFPLGNNRVQFAVVLGVYVPVGAQYRNGAFQFYLQFDTSHSGRFFAYELGTQTEAPTVGEGTFQLIQ